MGIQKLPKAVSAEIVSTSSVQSQSSILKELIENSIDTILEKIRGSGSKTGQISIEIDKETAGLEYLSVRDDGLGVEKKDRNLMCLNHTTSKIHSADELFNGVLTCGFRGEALNFIARLSKSMEINTKVETETLVECWTVTNSGIPNSDFKTVPGATGTMIKLTGLFKSTPVRYKFLRERKHKTLKELERLVMTYSLIYRSIRFQLKHVKVISGNKFQILENKTFYTKSKRIHSLSDLLGLRKQDWFFESEFEIKMKPFRDADAYLAKINIIAPYMKAESIPTLKHNIKVLAVNDKPLNLSLKFGRTISSQINESYSKALLLTPPVWYVSFNIPSNTVDFNIEPAKSDIMIANEEELIAQFTNQFKCIVYEKHNMNNLQIHKKVDTSVSNVNAAIEMNFADDFDLSNDDIFIDNLESSLKHLQKQYQQDVTENFSTSIEESESLGEVATKPLLVTNHQRNHTLKSPTQTVPENNTLIFKDVVKEFTTELENEECNDGSRSIYDETDIPCGIQSPKSVLSYQEDSSQKKASILELNPRTITELAKEIKESTKDSDDTLVDTDTEVRAKVYSETKTKHSEQMSITDFGTYQIKEIKKISKPKTAAKLPKLSESSQNTLNEILSVKMAFDVDPQYRKTQMIGDEEWVHRLDIPTEVVTQSALNLYNKSQFKAMDAAPKLNELGIFKLM